MTVESDRALRVLEAIAEDPTITQRRLALRLGIALGLTNLCLRRLMTEGYVECVAARAGRASYRLTPKGMREQSRLTCEFMQHSLHLYSKARRHMRQMLARVATSRDSRIAVYGTGDAVELTLLSLRELLIEPVAILEHQPAAGCLFGLPVRDIDRDSLDAYDGVIVATLGNPTSMVRTLVRGGLVREKIFTLRPCAAVESATAS